MIFLLRILSHPFHVVFRSLEMPRFKVVHEVVYEWVFIAELGIYTPVIISAGATTTHEVI